MFLRCFLLGNHMLQNEYMLSTKSLCDNLLDYRVRLHSQRLRDPKNSNGSWHHFKDQQVPLSPKTMMNILDTCQTGHLRDGQN